MRKILAVLALLLAGSGVVWADNIPPVVSATTSTPWTRTVFNDSGGTLVHGAVVVWDTDDTELDRSGYPYITTTATADFIHVAGIMLTGTCLDQTLCDIVVKGYARGRASGTALTEDTLVATSGTASNLGDYTPAANTCAVGTLLEYTSDTGAACGTGLCNPAVNVNISCQ